MSYAKKNLREVEDSAAAHGLSEQQEARFPRSDLGAEQTGLNLLTVKPGQREAFAVVVFQADARPADRDTAPFAQHRIERAHQPAWRAGEAHLAAFALGAEGEPVADNDQAILRGRRVSLLARPGCAFHHVPT